jgi:ABC-type transport system substrate-binding protein
MYFEFIGFNTQNEIFQNIHMRRGVAHAFDADEAVSAVYLNHGVRTASPIHPYSFVSANVGGAAYNAARARALLNAVPIARPLIIIANEDNPQRVSIAESLAASLNAVGTPASALIVHYEEYFARLEDGDFDLFVGGVNLAFSPDVEFFFSGGFYLEDYVLAEAFAAIKSAYTEYDYLRAVRQFQQTFAERLPVISLVFRHSSVLTNRRIVQHAAPPADNIFGLVNLWSIE